ncbi:hypothetical protein HKD37_07G019602 [Glycine soja]
MYIYGCPGSNMGIESGVLEYLVWFNVCFLVNKFKQMHKGHELVDHESFYVVTNEGGALISVADFTVVVNTNIRSLVTHCCSD